MLQRSIDKEALTLSKVLSGVIKPGMEQNELWNQSGHGPLLKYIFKSKMASSYFVH